MKEYTERVRSEWLGERHVKAKDAADRGLNILEYLDESSKDCQYIGATNWEYTLFLYYKKNLHCHIPKTHIQPMEGSIKGTIQELPC